MASSPEGFVDTRRPVDRFLGNYSEDHRNPVNQLVHWICVPLIVWTVIAALWLVPVPAAIGRPGFWAGAVMVVALLYYLELSRPLALAMLVAFAALAAITHLIHATFGPAVLLWSAISVFVASWIAQFIGHAVEGKRPSFLTDMVYLLIGPLWLMSKLFRRAGWSY